MFHHISQIMVIKMFQKFPLVFQWHHKFFHVKEITQLSILINMWSPWSTSRNQPKCNHSIYDYMRLVVVCDWIWEHLQLQNQISTILVILTTMMQVLKFSSYWLDRFYIHFHPLIGWYVPLVEVVTKLVAS
jgi:hypothetical protein